MAQDTKEQQVKREVQRVRGEIEALRDDLGDTLDELTYRASPRHVVSRRTSRMRRTAMNIRHRVMGSAQHTADSMQATARGTIDHATSTVDELAEQARRAPEMVERQTAGNPLAAGVVAFGAGLLLASLFSPTDTEVDAAT